MKYKTLNSKEFFKNIKENKINEIDKQNKIKTLGLITSIFQNKKIMMKAVACHFLEDGDAVQVNYESQMSFFESCGAVSATNPFYTQLLSVDENNYTSHEILHFDDDNSVLKPDFEVGSYLPFLMRLGILMMLNTKFRLHLEEHILQKISCERRS